ncbi:hypothetical protein [Paraconexibacter algicola]|uniref:Heme exporter protein D n=1 Tax=Paraconexibacter algicola TaxID=2133960 RepID=A0A2T4UE32_9ACTN|nr:hypothetical protein [Paraconexibacter algicola]PTL55769.1 hypothetical protein C7Y72_19260 [Paraconexibacter algicola]
MPSVDWEYFLPILVCWAVVLAVFVVLVLIEVRAERRDRQAAARRPLAPVIPLDLSRARRREVARRKATR